MLRSLMQDDFPLSVAHIRRRMQDAFPDRRVSTLGESGLTHASYGDVAERIERLGHVLRDLGVRSGDRVATFAWNSQRHLELYFAIPSSGAVLHTLNVRLAAEQLAYIVDDAQDTVVFVDDTLVAQLAPLASSMPSVRTWVVMGDGPTHGLPGALRYEELLAAAPTSTVAWPDVDERAAAALCYTSGTTGSPKGVLYSHRSIALHATSNLFVDGVAMSSRDRVLSVVPMFHVNAWGAPFAAPLCGAELVFPTRFLQAEHLARLISDLRPTMMNGVPTIYADLLRYADREHPDLTSLTNAICGGSAVPRALTEGLQERHGVVVHQAWGMTETSPIVTVSRPPADLAVGDAAYWDSRSAQGRVMPWCEVRLRHPERPAAGVTTTADEGEIEVRGPWVAADYFGRAHQPDPREWLATGDIGSFDRLGFLRITDRAKDVIKSGGEWISSVALENELSAHPDVLEAAVIAVADERWGERPLACVVPGERRRPSPDELRAFLAERVDRWVIPDAFVFVDEVPKTSTGKLDKKALRAGVAAGDIGPRRSVAAVTDPDRGR
ncbi:MAG: long-chain fatty acid--CoA ligase [Solirubrobacteraceae bacterium]